MQDPENDSSHTPSHRTLPPNAFTRTFLARLHHRDEPAPERPAGVYAGPWEVERMEVAGRPAWAVVRRGEPLAAGGKAVAVFFRRTPALWTAAALPALGTPNLFHLGSHRKRLGVPLHRGREHQGHLARPEPDLLPLLHALSVLAAHPDALALLLESCGGESLAILGRALGGRIWAG